MTAGSGQLTKGRWNVPAERPEGYSEVLQNSEPRNNSKNKQTNDRPKDGFTSTNSRAYDRNYSRSSTFSCVKTSKKCFAKKAFLKS